LKDKGFNYTNHAAADMSAGDIGRQFSRLTIAAVEAPEAVQWEDLFEAANRFLDAARAGDATGLELARDLAERAMGRAWAHCLRIALLTEQTALSVAPLVASMLAATLASVLAVALSLLAAVPVLSALALCRSGRVVSGRDVRRRTWPRTLPLYPRPQ
jgi:hypothetical protein